MVHAGPRRPVGMEMPELGQMIFTTGNLIILAVVLVLAVQYSRKASNPIALLFILGGGLAVLFEPIVDVLGLCHFPEVGSWELFTAFGVTLPFYTLPTFAWYVGGQAFFFYRTLEQGITPSGVAKAWVIFAVSNALLEIPALQMGTFLYYGAQPFEVFGFPLWWSFCNAMGPIVAAVIVFTLRDHFKGWASLLIIVIVPMSHALSNAAIAWPTWLALNSGYGYSLSYPAGFASLGLACVILYILGAVISKQEDRGEITQAVPA